MPRQRHWVNRAQGGEMVFVTTTVLDFVHAFRRHEPRDEMVSVLLHECKAKEAMLHAYVVMPHHLHFVAMLPEPTPVSRLMRQVKAVSAAKIMPMLTATEMAGFDQQRGLNRNTFWQRSFRSVVILSEAVYWQKINYIHQNPVRAGYSDSVLGYEWSSAGLWEADRWSEEQGLEL